MMIIVFVMFFLLSSSYVKYFSQLLSFRTCSADNSSLVLFTGESTVSWLAWHEKTSDRNLKRCTRTWKRECMEWWEERKTRRSKGINIQGSQNLWNLFLFPSFFCYSLGSKSCINYINPLSHSWSLLLPVQLCFFIISRIPNLTILLIITKVTSVRIKWSGKTSFKKV